MQLSPDPRAPCAGQLCQTTCSYGHLVYCSEAPYFVLCHCLTMDYQILPNVGSVGIHIL